MNFLKNAKNLKNFFKPRYLFGMMARFFGRYARFFIFLIALAMVIFCVYLWYGTIYHSQWNDSQKQEYIKNKGQGTTFNEKGFEYDVASAAARHDESQKDLGNLTDIFRLNKDVAPVTPAAPVNAKTTPPAKSAPGVTAAPSTTVIP